jgi:murein L,D-transpeptidase YafK
MRRYSDSEPNRRSARKRWGFFALVLIGGVVAAFLTRDLWLGDAEHQAIRLEREYRATLADFGITLPGTPDLADFDGRLKAHGVALGTPVFFRIFKREFELELWLLRDGRFHRFATYPICRWSGRLGPKLVQGDRQAPEGFYTVDEQALNPDSKWHRSFNLGFPNAFDRAHGRTGSLIMVHGGCGSIGCFAMTNPVIDEIWRLITAALRNGQKRFQVQVFPFRMTDGNLARHADSPLAPFWTNLKMGYDLFEAELMPPKVSVCQGRYAFEPVGASSDGSAPIETKCPQSKPAA